MKYQFKIKQTIIVDDVKCMIVAREIFDNLPDYLCVPCDSQTSRITKTGHELPGWIRAENIKKI
jgi:hypothetical protein